jgi:hypothetical protein
MPVTIASILLWALLSSCAARPQAQVVSADITNARCKLAIAYDVDAPDFQTYVCITPTDVDAPYIAAGRVHVPALYVRVPLRESMRFAYEHPAPQQLGEAL